MEIRLFKISQVKNGLPELCSLHTIMQNMSFSLQYDYDEVIRPIFYY